LTELTQLSAAEMAAEIRRKQISPVELMQAHAARIERLNPKINAIISFDAANALKQAQAAETAVMRGTELGPLHGVPVTIKSSIDVAGLRCAAGSKLRADYIAAQDAPLVARLRAAGAIVLGNTNTPEMLMAYVTENVLHGRTNNPWDLARTPGGSSGGESAAIAACCSAAGVGSDGGGSIRVPAHFCGICGLKPTPGRIPSTGHYPPSLGPFAWLGVVGPMARTVRDLELMLEVMAGPDDGDACAAPVAYRRMSEAEIRSTRIGYFEDDGMLVTPETRAAVRAAAEALVQQGFEVAPFRPEGLEKIHKLWWTFFGSVAHMLFGPLVTGRESELSPVLQDYFEYAGMEIPLTAQSLLNALLERDICRVQLLSQMETFPVLLCPVSDGPAFRHGEQGWMKTGGRASFHDTMRFSQWFNLTGNPAVVVPASRSPEGLPIGVQIVGRPFAEELVLAIAERIEQALGGWQKPPLY
jgi:Asp-tRNA(Asn)/Glu-tRNA(Gln) amidotransferase A subunit family amidase